MRDEEYVFRQESREKAITSRSAHSRRTHCGRGGRVKLPSDYMTKKELNAMNGEVKTYRLNEPMKWHEFVAMPDEHKETYIKLIRNKWNPSDKYIAQMLGICPYSLCKELQRLGLNNGNRSGRTKWDKEGFLAWANGVPQNAVEETVEEAEEVVETPAEEVKETPVCCLPKNGEMRFEGNADEILNTLSAILRGARVNLNVWWQLDEGKVMEVHYVETSEG